MSLFFTPQAFYRYHIGHMDAQQRRAAVALCRQDHRRRRRQRSIEMVSLSSAGSETRQLVAESTFTRTISDESPEVAGNEQQQQEQSQ